MFVFCVCVLCLYFVFVILAFDLVYMVDGWWGGILGSAVTDTS